ncbi:VOC family protein [Streptomyces xiamenensis]|uniref:VOC family protein n=1 Tax=Streptomyces xiamenensis TaxID=408015 RepID=UPI0036EFE95C
MAPRCDLIGLITDDLSASLAFYRRLGLDIPDTAPDTPHVEALLPGGLRLAWDSVATITSFQPDWTPPRGGQRMSLAFLCDSPAEVDSLYAELTATGHPGATPPWDAVWGQRYATVLDPDGNHIDLFAPLG